MMRIILVALAISMILSWVLYHAEALGGDDPQLPEFNAHCSDDVNRFCSGVTRGRGRVFTCLRANKEKISENCHDYIAGKLNKVMSSFLSFRTNCGDDYSKFCKNVERGEGRVMQCLWMRSSEISTDCKKQIAPFRLFEY
ncbi:MAG: hypothetical protein A2176_02040 [Spirochaetes bacterium RBG_13_51_14]|nr:MAG: hypothetical protein A2176_02040 [Spirochaetes bacterium RBG_13_51_14]